MFGCLHDEFEVAMPDGTSLFSQWCSANVDPCSDDYPKTSAERQISCIDSSLQNYRR